MQFPRQPGQSGGLVTGDTWAAAARLTDNFLAEPSVNVWILKCSYSQFYLGQILHKATPPVHQRSRVRRQHCPAH